MKLYTSLDQINNATARFARIGNKVQLEAHKIACSVLRHVGEHGDIRVVENFLNALPASYRTNAVKKWFETFGPVSFADNKLAFVRTAKTRLGEAMDMPFWKLVKEEAYVPINVAAALESLIKKLEKDQKATGRSHAGTIAALKQAPVSELLQITFQG